MTHSARVSKSLWFRGGVIAAIGVGLAGAVPRAVAAVGPSLGAARSFVVLGGSSISNSGATSYFDGDVGVSPGSSVSGFAASQVSGGIFVGGSTEADNAHSDAALAYAFLSGMVSTTNLTGTDLGGLTLDPGVYKFNSSAQLTGQLFLDAGGDSGAVFIFQIGSTLTTASSSQVTVINGGADYDESQTYWQVGSSATVGSGSAFVGNILAYADVTIVSGSTMKGNAYALGGSVTTDSNSMTSPPLAPVLPVLTAAPINLTAELAGSPVIPAADLSWNDASNNETEFRVFRRDGAGPGFTQIAVVPSTSTAGTGAMVTYQDTGLERNKVYTYRVTAFGTAAGESAPSNEALVDTAVFVPINLTAVLNGSPVTPAANLSWNDASDNETQFRVYRKTGANVLFTQIAIVNSTTTAGTGAVVTYQDPGLERMKVYTYRVTAFSPTDGESLPSNEAQVDTGVFLPINLTAVLNGSPVVPAADLSWNDASDNETEFRVFRRTGAESAFVQIGTVPSTSMSGIGDTVTFKNTELEPGKIYSYRVTAFSASAGESFPSNVAMVDTGIFVPIDLEAVLSGSTETPGTDLTWTDVSDNETAFRIYRKDGPDGDFILIATVPSANTPGTGTVMSYNDPVLDYLMTFTYRVTAVSASGAESVPSNEASIGTTFGPAIRWVNLHLGQGRNRVRDRVRQGQDQIRLKGSYTVMDVESQVPTVIYGEDPTTTGLTIQVRAPNNMVLIVIPANDPTWRVSAKGVYRWKSKNGWGAPVYWVRIDPRRSEFRLKAKRLEFGTVPSNDIMVSLGTQGAVGSETRPWENPSDVSTKTEVLYLLSR